jgi:gas vesicle protein
MGFIIGLLAGAIVALLYAPKTGDITREELKVRSEELKRRADELQKVAQKLADDASVKGRELIDEAKKQWDSSGAGRASTGASSGASTGARSTPGGSTKAD